MEKTMNLVTGASGFIGGRIVHALINRGEDVRILVRPNSDLQGIFGLKYEIVYGDILDRDSLNKAVQGCKRVYHAAALYKLWNKDRQIIYRINIDGTRNVIEMCLKNKVERIIYTSSSATIGIPHNGIGNEGTSVSISDMVGDYKRSKFYAELAAMEYVKNGVPLVIVNPTYPVGQGDVKPTPTGQMIVDFLKGKMPAYLDTGLNIVDVDDVAIGHLLAADKGEIGRRYILGNTNMTLKEILYLMSDLTGLPKPYLKLPYYPILALSYIDTAISKIIDGRQPRIPTDGVKMAKKKMFFDASLAVSELGMPQTKPAAALQKAIDWFKNNGYV
jgi:dihydroflavonol-4-reductase